VIFDSLRRTEKTSFAVKPFAIEYCI